MEKSIRQLFLERHLPYDRLLDLNKQEKKEHYKENMLDFIHQPENLEEDLKLINVDRTIILSTPEDETVIRQNIDGTFSLVLNHNENLSACQSSQDGKMAVVDYYPNLKISVPQGFKIQIDDPSLGFCFFDKIYPDCQIIYPDAEGKINEEANAADISFTDLPNRFILQKFKFTFHIDLQRMRNINKTLYLKKGQTVANMFFITLPHNWNNKDANFALIKNDEVYKQFTTIF